MGSLDQKSALENLPNVDAVYAVYDPSVKINQMASPTKFFEAMAFDRPVIVCRGTTIDKLVEDAGVGVVVDYHAASIKSALMALKSGDARARYLRNIKSIKGGYLWETSENNLYETYKTIEARARLDRDAVMQ
jgi:glycosyltransferase involved in cell wall biosynthesis